MEIAQVYFDHSRSPSEHIASRDGLNQLIVDTEETRVNFTFPFPLAM